MSRRRVTARSNGDDGSHSHTLDDGAKLDDPPHLSTSSPSASDSTSTDGIAEKSRMPYSKKSWIVFALASGACAAFNGVFAKLTTTELTTSIAASIAKFLHLGPENHVVEYIVRALSFILNLAFNALMWVLFTRALTLGTTTRVSILNTSANFLFTAILGLLIFRESLPPLWFVGAGMLVIGNVIIGRREEEGDKPPMPEIGGLSVSEIESEEGLLAVMHGEEQGVRLANVTGDEEVGHENLR